MKFKPLIELKLEEVFKKDYTFGQILYSIFRKKYLNNKPEGVSTAWLMDISDRDFYTAIELFLEDENN